MVASCVSKLGRFGTGLQHVYHHLALLVRHRPAQNNLSVTWYVWLHVWFFIPWWISLPSRSVSADLCSFVSQNLAKPLLYVSLLQSQNLSDISILCNYVHLQKLEVPHNKIKGDFMLLASFNVHILLFSSGLNLLMQLKSWISRSILCEPHAFPRDPGRFPQWNHQLFWIPATQESDGRTLNWQDKTAFDCWLGLFSFVLFPQDRPGFTLPICSHSEYAYEASAALGWQWTIAN